MSDKNKSTEAKDANQEIKKLTLEDLKRVRGGYVPPTEGDDYNRDKCKAT